MNLISGLVLLPLLLIAPGYITVRALSRDDESFSSGERIFVPIAIGILLASWLALVLAELGRFSLLNLAALLALYCALLLVLRRGAFFGSTRGAKQNPRAGLSPDWALLLILALGAVLVARPAEYILGGYDAGTYINIGISIARTGGIAIHDAVVQSLGYDPSRQFWFDLTNPFMLYTQMRLPGFFVADAARGLVLPQFLHLYPAWLAIFDVALGPRWGLYGTPAIGLLGSVAAYFVARQLFGRNLARLAFFLLVIDVPQFWFARYPVAEAMTQFLALTGMYAFLRSPGLALREGADEAPLLPLIAGAAFGEILLTRTDAVVLLAPLGLYAILVIFLRLWRRAHWFFSITFVPLLLQAMWHYWTFAPDYVYFEVAHVLRMKNLDKLLPGGLPSAADFLGSPFSLLPLAAVGVAGLIVLFALDRVAQFGRRRASGRMPAWLPTALDRLRWLGAALLVAGFVFAYFIWPHPSTLYAYVGGETTADRAGNLIKLGWYLSPIGLALALLGAIIVLRRDLNRHTAFFLGSSALMTLFYVEELYSNPHYIYTMRHYIPLVIPLLILLASRGLEFLWRFELPNLRWERYRRAVRVAAGGSLALWLLYNTYAMGLIDASRATGLALRVPFIAQTVGLGAVRLEPLERSIVGMTDLGGAFDQLEQLAAKLDPNAIVIFSNNRDEPGKLATPLRYFYDRDALIARFNQPNGDKIAALIDRWRAEGREVVLAYGTNGGKLTVPRYSLEPLGDYALDVSQWAFAYQYMPRAAWRVNMNYALYRAVPATQNPPDPYLIDFGGDDYPALVGGFLERRTGEASRWMGALPGQSEASARAKQVTATLRLPVLGRDGDLYFTLVARAPADGVLLIVKNGKIEFGSARLTTEFQGYQFTLPRASLRRDGDTFLFELASTASLAPDGRIVGAELKQAVFSTQPGAPLK